MKKSLALVLCTIFMVMNFASCTKNGVNQEHLKSEIKYYEENGEWWDDSAAVVPHGFGDTQQMPIYEGDTYAVVYLTNWIDQDGIYKFNYDGSYYKYINIPEQLGDDYIGFSDVRYYEYQGKSFCLINYYSNLHEDNMIDVVEVDWDNESMKFDSHVDTNDLMGKRIEKVFSIEDTIYYVLSDADGNIYYYAANTNHEMIPFNFGVGITSVFVEDLATNGDTVHMLVYVSDSSYQLKEMYIRYNLKTEEYFEKEIVNDTEMLIYSLREDGLFYVSEESVGMYDVESDSFVEYLQFENTYINRVEYGFNFFMHLSYASENRVVFQVDEPVIQNGMGPYKYITLTKADSNPNDGKILLSVANVEGVYEYRTISQFNKTNSDYYIVADHRYDASNWLQDEYDTSEYYNAINQAVCQLMVDIESGIGPDIVYTDEWTSQLNNGRYLIDVASRINSEESIINGNYAPQVFQSVDGDGSIYSLLYGLRPVGIIVNKSMLSNPETKGQTYDDYYQFIDENNIPSVLRGDKSFMFSKLFLASSNDFFDDEGKLDIDNQEFRAMAEFVRDLPEGQFNNDIDTLSDYAVFLNDGITFLTLKQYYGRFYGDYSIIGLPSFDGAPMSLTGEGISITNCCPLEDAAWEYIKTKLNYETQFAFAKSVSFVPVNLDAYKDCSKAMIDFENSAPYRDYLVGEDGIPYDIIDYFIGYVQGAELVRTVDVGITVIINEELQSYFVGQKSIDEVIPIIEDRVNNMLSERG